MTRTREEMYVSALEKELEDMKCRLRVLFGKIGGYAQYTGIPREKAGEAVGELQRAILWYDQVSVALKDAQVLAGVVAVKGETTHG